MKNVHFCTDCRIDILKDLKDFYMVKDHLWEQYGVGQGMLCVDCFEKRLGRKLTPSDLMFCYVNTMVNPNTIEIFIKESKKIN